MGAPARLLSTRRPETMVAVLMGDENGGQISGCDTQGGQTGSDLFG